MNRPSLHALLGLALIFGLVGFAPAPSWAGCKNAGGGGSSFNYGSEVSGSAVTICLNTSAVTPARTSTIAKVLPKVVAKVAPKLVAKATPKLVAKVAPKPLTLADIRALMRASDAVLAKPTLVAKPKPTLKPKLVVKTPTSAVLVASNTPSNSTNSNGSAYFSPDETSAAVSPSNNLSEGQTATFFSDPKVHYRLGSVLGKSAEVRFSPISATWTFGDGSSASGAQATHQFGAGVFSVEVTIIYAVSYRFSGQDSWVADPGQIEMPAMVLVNVGDSGSQEALLEPSIELRLPYLVSANCIANARAVGCF